MPPKPRRSQQEALLCSLCRKAVGSFEPMHKGELHLGELAHAKCLVSRVCCFCGQHGMTLDCSSAECMRVLHSWCLSRFALSEAALCDLHSHVTLQRKRDIRLSLIREQVSQVSLSGLWLHDYRAKDSPGSCQPGTLCSGNIFWFVVCSQYFPALIPLKSIPYFPLFPVLSFSLPDFPSVSPAESFVELQIAEIEAQLRGVRSDIRELSFIPNKISSVKFPLSEEDQLLCEIRHNSYSHEFDCMLPQKETEQPSKTELSSLALRKDQSCAEETCSVCGDTDYEDDDLLAVCSLCSLSVHQKCYGLSGVSELWVCDVCVAFGKTKRQRVPCALCPIRGGALKATVHNNDGTVPNYATPRKRLRDDCEQPEYPKRVWVHMFCALHIEGVQIASLSTMEGINVSNVDLRRFSMKCEVCQKREGACLQCSFGKCSAAFHPECSKALFISSRGDMPRVYCVLHRPLKLRKILESRDKKLAEDLNKFCKAFQRWEAKTNIKSPRKRKDRCREGNSRPFSPDEDQVLQYRLHKLLCEVHLAQSSPFQVVIETKANSRRSQVQIHRPQCFNLVTPEVILEEHLTTESRSVEECYRRYSEFLFHHWKNQLILRKQGVRLYNGKDQQKQQVLLARLKAQTQEQRQSKRVKVPVVTPVGPECTVERYCLCKQPYYYYMTKEQKETDEDYAVRVRNNAMLACSNCSQWYHLGCVQYSGTPEQADNDESWECPLCRKPAKTVKAGVRTRRQLVC